VLPREPFLAIWAGVCFLIVLYILGVFTMKLDSPLDRVSGIRAFFAVIFASMGFYFMGGMMGNPLAADLEALLPPENYQELIDGTPSSASMAPPTTGAKTEQAPAGEVWLTNLDEAKKIAKETNKPIFIDFTGFACTNCRWMEKKMFPKNSVQTRFDKMVLVQLFTDRKEEPYITNQNLMRGYGTVANPLYVILKPDGSFVAQSAYTRDEQAFLTFLDQAL
jgi:thioredoxin-related protein